jgi:hypothetical protein
MDKRDKVASSSAQDISALRLPDEEGTEIVAV